MTAAREVGRWVYVTGEGWTRAYTSHEAVDLVNGDAVDGVMLRGEQPPDRIVPTETTP